MAAIVFGHLYDKLPTLIFQVRFQWLTVIGDGENANDNFYVVTILRASEHWVVSRLDQGGRYPAIVLRSVILSIFHHWKKLLLPIEYRISIGQVLPKLRYESISMNLTRAFSQPKIF